MKISLDIFNGAKKSLFDRPKAGPMTVSLIQVAEATQSLRKVVIPQEGLSWYYNIKECDLPVLDAPDVTMLYSTKLEEIGLQKSFYFSSHWKSTFA